MCGRSHDLQHGRFGGDGTDGFVIDGIEYDVIAAHAETDELEIFYVYEVELRAMTSRSAAGDGGVRG
jgi:hypothetical protein